MKTHSLLHLMLFSGALVCAFGVMADGLPHNDGGGYSEGMTLIRNLPKKMNAHDCALYLQYLAEPDGNEPLPDNQTAVLRNELTLHFLDNNIYLDLLAETLISARNQPKHDVVWREFTLQHLGQALLQIREEGNPDDIALLQKIEQTLYTATEQKQDADAGTALIALHRGGADEKIYDRCAEVSMDESYSLSARTTAMILLTEKKDPRALLAARDALKNTRSVPFRLSALHTLGAFQKTEDLPLLAQYQTNPIPLLRNAAKTVSLQENTGELKP